MHKCNCRQCTNVIDVGHMTVRNIQAHLKELYSVDVSPDLISQVTDAVVQEVREWQHRPLDPVYPVIIFDGLRVKIRDEGVVKTKCIYLAMAFTLEGKKDILGLWIEQTEGAKVLAQSHERTKEPRRSRCVNSCS